MSAQIIAFPKPAPTSETAALAQRMITRLDTLDNLSSSLAEAAATLKLMIKEHWHNAPEMLRYKLVAAYSELLCLNDCNPDRPTRQN